LQLLGYEKRFHTAWARSGSRQEAYFFFFIAAVTYGFLAA
jgi:hypothetical protein